MSEIDDEVLKERVRRMLDHCELSNVRVVEFSGKRFDDHGEPVTAHLASEAGYLVNEHAFLNRYVWEAKLVDANDAPVAEFNATVLVEYDLHEGFEPDTDAAGAISGSTGYFAAYPYVRELLQSSATRLMLGPMVLGMLLAGSTRPRGVTITRATDYGSKAVAHASGSEGFALPTLDKSP